MRVRLRRGGDPVFWQSSSLGARQQDARDVEISSGVSHLNLLFSLSHVKNLFDF